LPRELMMIRDAAMAGQRAMSHALAAVRDGDTIRSQLSPLGERESVGGLLAPLTEDYTVCDLAVELRLALLIAARPGLGTINHTLLTLRAARAAGLEVRAVVLTPWPAQPSELERSNRETIARIGRVEVAVLGHLAAADLDELARAGATLPWRSWLASG